MYPRAFVAIALAVLSTTSTLARGPFGSLKIGNWNGGAFTNDKDDTFTGCVASASYASGITLSVMVSANITWKLAFTNDNWSLSPGSAFPMVLTFDGRPPFNVSGQVLSARMIGVAMPDNSELIEQFQASKTMSAFARGTLFQFRLDKTRMLLPALVNCVQTINRDGLAAAKDFVLPQRATGAAAPAPQAPENGSPKPASAPSSSNAELQLEAMELASNFILKASLNNPRVLSRTEAPVAVKNGAAWRSDDATGYVTIIPAREGVKGLDVATMVVADDARSCKGKFASARNSELVDSDVVFRGMSSCEDSERADITQYFIVPRKKGGFVMFSVVSNLRIEEAKSPAREQRNTDFRKAALIAVGP